MGSISAAHSSSGMSAGSFPETAAGNRALGHFRVHVCLLFKASLIAKFFSRILVFIHRVRVRVREVSVRRGLTVLYVSAGQTSLLQVK